MRHGRSTSPPGGWIDADGVRRWLLAYEQAGLIAGEVPPPALRELASAAGVVVTSDITRARESAALLKPDGVFESALLRETPMPMPTVRGETMRGRLPALAWGTLMRLTAALRTRRGTWPPEQVRTQAVEGARWLETLAERHERVVAVTHANVREQIAAALVATGWRRVPGGPRFAYWSAWTFVRESRS